MGRAVGGRGTGSNDRPPTGPIILRRPEALADYLRTFRLANPKWAGVILVLAMMRDKDHRGLVEFFKGLVDEVVVTQADLKRSATADELLPLVVESWPRGENERTGLGGARHRQTACTPTRFDCVTGSLMLVGEVKASLRGCGLSRLRG